VVAIAPRLAEGGAQHRREHHGHDERGDQRRRQRDRQILHVLADHARPEHQRQEHHDGDRERAGDRPGHGARRLAVGLEARHAFDHLAVGVFHQDDGAVDQHAGGQDQAEQHDHVDGQPGDGEDEDAHEKGGGNRDPDHGAAAQAERPDDDDHHQQDREDQAVLQLLEHVADVTRSVLRVADSDLRRPVLALALDRLAHLGDGVDDVLAGALRHFEGDGRLPVDTGVALGVLVGAL
jgi:hypothetical protein